ALRRPSSSFPTRRSSDLAEALRSTGGVLAGQLDPAGTHGCEQHLAQARRRLLPGGVGAPVGHRAGAPAPTVARDSSVAKCSAFCIADGPSAWALIRTTRSSLIEVPVSPWSASQAGSVQVAGSRSMRRTAPQFRAMVSSVLRPPSG